MTPNHTSAKAKLFALYLGQKVFSHPDYSNRMAGRLLDDPIVELTISILYGNYIKKGWLQLRTIEDLTDEEIKQLADICDLIPIDEMVIDRMDKFFNVYSKYSESAYPDYLSIYFNGEVFKWVDYIAIGIDCERCFIIQDYLRSISIALPFTVLEDGKPRTYSVEEQVENKWIQLNNSK